MLALGKAHYLAVASITLCLAGNLDTNQFCLVRHWPAEGGPVFTTHFATWDAAHYLYLSEAGYAAGVHSCAFYPLWPLLMRWFARASGTSHLIAGLLLANLFSLAAWVLLHRIVRQRWSAQTASWTLVWLMAFPGSLFYQFVYSEGLFLLLLMLLWWGLENRRPGLAAVAAFLLPLTRAIGLFCLLPIGWHLLTVDTPRCVQGWARRWRWLRVLGVPEVPQDRPPVATAGLNPYWLLLAPVVGWGVYLSLMWHWTGNPFEGFEAQKHWATHSIGNLVNVPRFLFALANPTAWHEYSGSLLDRCVFIVLLNCLPVIWKLDRSRSLMIWTYVLGIMPAMSGTFTSYTRFASCAFPMFIALGVSLAPPQRRYLRWATLAVFAILHLVLVWRFVNFRWAG